MLTMRWIYIEHGCPRRLILNVTFSRRYSSSSCLDISSSDCACLILSSLSLRASRMLCLLAWYSRRFCFKFSFSCFNLLRFSSLLSRDLTGGLLGSYVDLKEFKFLAINSFSLEFMSQDYIFLVTSRGTHVSEDLLRIHIPSNNLFWGFSLCFRWFPIYIWPYRPMDRGLISITVCARVQILPWPSCGVPE